MIILSTYADHLLCVLRTSTHCICNCIGLCLVMNLLISQWLWRWRCHVLFSEFTVKVVTISSNMSGDVALSFIWGCLVIVIETSLIRWRLELLQVEHWNFPLYLRVVLEISNRFGAWWILLCALFDNLLLTSLYCAAVDWINLGYMRVMKIDIILRILFLAFKRTNKVAWLSRGLCSRGCWLLLNDLLNLFN